MEGQVTADHVAGGLQALVYTLPWNRMQPTPRQGTTPGSEPLPFSSVISKPITYCQSPYLFSKIPRLLSKRG